VLSPSYKEAELDRTKIKDWRRPGAVTVSRKSVEEED